MIGSSLTFSSLDTIVSITRKATGKRWSNNWQQTTRYLLLKLKLFLYSESIFIKKFHVNKKNPTTWVADIRHGKEKHIVNYWISLIVIEYITTTFWQFLLLYQLIHPSNRAQIITDLMALVRYSTFIHI